MYYTTLRGPPSTSFVDVTLVHHLLGLEDILVMHAVYDSFWEILASQQPSDSLKSELHGLHVGLIWTP
jgi:hypothetical protein